MRIKIRDLKRLIREAAEESLEEYDYSRGGAGGNRWGDSYDVADDEGGYEDRMRAGRERREREANTPEKEIDVNPYTEAVNEAFRAGYKRGLKAASVRKTRR